MKAVVIFSLFIAATMASYGHGGGSYGEGLYEGDEQYGESNYGRGEQYGERHYGRGESHGEGHYGGRHHGSHGRGHYFKNFVLASREKSLLHRLHSQCQEESSCELEYIQDPFRYEDYEPLGDYMLCLAKGYGFMGRHGQLNMENLRYKLGMICGEEDPEYYIKTCAVPGEYPVNTAFGLWRCLDNHGFHFLKECL
uniref:Uncharacterized protein LOC114332641 n=1 Tax=Diabrotica virgifera virgifera TaxID=50390 RepID=A0A6P7FPI2_DIAVI